MTGYERDMKRTFVGVTDAVCAQVLMPENLQEYIKSTCNQKVTKKDCTEVRTNIIDAFKKEMNIFFEEYSAESDFASAGKEIEKAKALKQKAWRISTDPAHNCHAQRYQAYQDFIDELRNQVRELTQDVKELKEELATSSN
ncbi:unnamed protein product [Bursaphelenchus xylophilus]|uniref:(pine wood nematode) hypothetical protein n=1 Tax=Bursaphelenchus xylophilus TaxID=6326 RepID=A0A1I7SMC4_BURXY|nr:unnamed protein product [Bursaphelenchus xylophilus]CAG9130109.1 unnamed protein product [Bursaphelenchus xylophilus]